MKLQLLVFCILSLVLVGCSSIGNAIVIETPNSAKQSAEQVRRTAPQERVTQDTEETTPNEPGAVVTETEPHQTEVLEDVFEDELAEIQEDAGEEAVMPVEEEQTGIDLLIESIETHHILSYYGDEGDTYTVQLLITVANTGYLAAPSAILNIDIASDEHTYNKRLNTGGISQKDTTKIRVDFPAIWAGTYTISLTADDENTVDENSETNNHFEQTLELS